MTFQILFQDANYVIISKPPGMFVHPPENSLARRHLGRNPTILSLLASQLSQYLYPVHRLDVATGGVLVFALNKAAARWFQNQLQCGQVEKTYELVCRGWLDDEGLIDYELSLDSTGAMVNAETHFKTLGRREFLSPAGYKYPFLRLSLIRANPTTGRYHQIRRHFNRISHPILGDNDHGDSRLNQFSRDSLGVPGLLLWAREIKFFDPDGQLIMINDPVNSNWQKLFFQFEALVQPKQTKMVVGALVQTC